MLARVDEYARVKDDDIAANRADYKKDRGKIESRKAPRKKIKEMIDRATKTIITKKWGQRPTRE